MYQRDPHVLFCKKNIMFTSHQKLCAQVMKLMFSEICCTGYQKGDSIFLCFLIAYCTLSGYVFLTIFYCKYLITCHICSLIVFTNSALWAELVRESTCPSVCLMSPSHAIFFRSLIGPQVT